MPAVNALEILRGLETEYIDNRVCCHTAFPDLALIAFFGFPSYRIAAMRQPTSVSYIP